MAKQESFLQTIRDIFPFGKEYDAVARAMKQSDSTNKDGHADNQKEDYLSHESFERYKQREIAVNTQTNFLHTLGGYLNMITTGLGGLAFGAMALKIPILGQALTALLPPAAAAAIGAATWGPILGLAGAAVVCGLVTLAIGQYNTRLNTEKNTNNTDWFQNRNSQMVGKAVAKELAPILQNQCDTAPVEPPHRDAKWTDKHPQRNAALPEIKAKPESWEQVLEAAENTPPSPSQRIH